MQKLCSEDHYSILVQAGLSYNLCTPQARVLLETLLEGAAAI